MEAGVVTPETGVRVDGDNGGDDLGGEEEKNGDVERSFGDLEFFVDDRFNCPDSGHKDSDKVNKHHLVEFENFGGVGPENEGGDEKQYVKKLADDFGQSFVGEKHRTSLTFLRSL